MPGLLDYFKPLQQPRPATNGALPGFLDKAAGLLSENAAKVFPTVEEQVAYSRGLLNPQVANDLFGRGMMNPELAKAYDEKMKNIAFAMNAFGKPSGSPLKFQSQIDDIQKYLDKLGIESKVTKSTRSKSTYLTLDDPSGETFKIRISDHPESGKSLALHGSSDFNVGNYDYADGASLDEALKAALKRFGK